MEILHKIWPVTNEVTLAVLFSIQEIFRQKGRKKSEYCIEEYCSNDLERKLTIFVLNSCVSFLRKTDHKAQVYMLKLCSRGGFMYYYL